MFSFQSTLEQWRFVFWVAFGVAMFRTIVFSIWASAEVQPWDQPKIYKSPEFYKLNELDVIDETKEYS